MSNPEAELFERTAAVLAAIHMMIPAEPKLGEVLAWSTWTFRPASWSLWPSATTASPGSCTRRGRSPNPRRR